MHKLEKKKKLKEIKEIQEKLFFVSFHQLYTVPCTTIFFEIFDLSDLNYIYY